MCNPNLLYLSQSVDLACGTARQPYRVDVGRHSVLIIWLLGIIVHYASRVVPGRSPKVNVEIVEDTLMA